ncbi:hypothetical protein ColTof4_13495 [Colletotrichum tofieldiae]|nr:hypothetical protein ColTof3_00430 [Colletotrichum tofieldiae]GKT81072.1 hypothetical protein ColTof4_13495 [Colletotrichum tofieldiae]GKT88514.1 hypothetical protein Ct61P_06364 [Colletotrichum tofieldiae]
MESISGMFTLTFSGPNDRRILTIVSFPFAQAYDKGVLFDLSGNSSFIVEIFSKQSTSSASPISASLDLVRSQQNLDQFQVFSLYGMKER